MDRLTTTIITTGPVPSVLDAVKDREQQREQLTRELAALEQAGRQMLKKLLTGPIKFTPVRDGGERYYTFTAPIGLDRLMRGRLVQLWWRPQRDPTPFRLFGPA